jgi:plastocyanin
MRPAVLVLGLALASPVGGGSLTAQGAEVEGVVGGAAPTGDIVVYLEARTSSSQARPRESPLVDQRDLRFIPTVTAVSSGTVVEFRNSDPILHNVFSPGAEAFDLGTYPQGESRSHQFTEHGPHVILCNVHPEMYAYVVVVPTPHHAVTTPDGRFRMENVPAGSYTLEVWRARRPALSWDLVVPADGTLSLSLNLDTGSLEILDHGR